MRPPVGGGEVEAEAARAGADEEHKRRGRFVKLVHLHLPVILRGRVKFSKRSVRQAPLRGLLYMRVPSWPACQGSCSVDRQTDVNDLNDKWISDTEVQPPAVSRYSKVQPALIMPVL